MSTFKVEEDFLDAASDSTDDYLTPRTGDTRQR